MYDSVIADMLGVGECDGIFGIEDFGEVDMFGDIRIDDLPTAEPRTTVPSSANVVVKAVASQIPKESLKRETVTKTPSAPAVSTTASRMITKVPVPYQPKTLATPRPKISRKAGMGIALGVGLLLVVAMTSKDDKKR